MNRFCVLMCLIGVAAQAQVSTQTRPTVTAIGDATITSAPDQVVVSFSVETRGNTAADAAAQNATQTAAVLGALQKFLGANGDIKTTGYSVQPIYSSPPSGIPSLNGFMATNTVQVTTGNLAQVGALLDTGTQAGATRAQGLTFSLKDPEPVRLQALRQAAQKARTHADAMAGGAGLHLGNVISMDEGGVAPRVLVGVAAAPTGTATTTPIDPGTVSITATVNMVFELVP